MSENTVEGSRPELLLNFGKKQRLPIVLQTESSECGLACLAMVAGFHGFMTDLNSLRQRFSVSTRGLHLKAMIDIAARLHIFARALKVETEDLEHVQAPAILHWDMNHYVVLKSVGRGHVWIHDPRIGEVKLSIEEFNQHFTGIVLELIPTEGFKPGKETRSLKLSQFWSRITGLKRSLTLIVTLALLLQLFAIVSPFYMQTVVDDVLIRKDDNLLLALAIGFGFLLCINVGTALLREVVILQVSTRLNMQMAANMFRHLIRLRMEYFTKRHLGDVVSRFASLGSIREMIASGFVTAIVDGLLAVMTLAAMFAYDAALALIALLTVTLYIALRLAMYRPLHFANQEFIVSNAKLASNFMESIRAIRVLKLFQRENDRQSQWQNALAESLNKQIGIARLNIGFDAARDLLYGLENIVVVYFAARAVMGDLITIGMLFAFMSFKGRFMNSVSALAARYVEFKMLDLHLDRLSDIAFSPTEDVDELEMQELGTEHVSTASESSGSLAGRIEVRNLGYRYGDSAPWVFSGLNFVIEPGETVALVGPSGCGKTTLILCLMGLLTPTEGDVLVDGKPLSRLYEYRKNIAGILQDDQLLSGSVADNISCFDPRSDIEYVKTCAGNACIHEEIMRMPMQYNTLVGDMGSTFSGGQQQRIVLARALYRRPRILFMDEATSHLDVQNESRVNEQIRKLSITRVLVAHRPQTISSADRQIVLQQSQLKPGARISV
jgi:ATP-binding cassette, subfamily B, bacterial CvaB/MchF/RaxB